MSKLDNYCALRRGPLLIALALICLLSWFHQDFFDFQHDDAYISYRYAVNWAEGYGPVYNRGEKVEGYSNFGLVAILAIVHALGGDVIVAARAIGTASCWAMILVIYLLIRIQMSRSVALALAGSAAIAFHAGLSAWGRGGLETTFFAFLILFSQYVFLDECRKTQAHWKSGLLFAIAAMTRADGFIFCIGAISYLFIGKRRKSEFLTFIISFLAIFIPYFIWRYNYYGELFPNTYYLKTGGSPFQQLRGLYYSYNFVVAFGGLVLFALPVLLTLFRDPRRDQSRLFLGASIIVMSGYIVWVGGDHMPMSRFYMPLVAPVLVLLLETVMEIQRQLIAPLAFNERPKKAIIGVLVVLLILSGFLPTLDPRRKPYADVIANLIVVEQWTKAGQWFKQNIDPNAVLASPVAGAAPFFAGHTTIDMLGVTDRHIAHTESDLVGRGTPGHEKQDFPYVLSRKPQIIFRLVHNFKCDAGKRITYPDGSVYISHCPSLGVGPIRNAFGKRYEGKLFLWYEERDILNSDQS